MLLDRLFNPRNEVISTSRELAEWLTKHSVATDAGVSVNGEKDILSQASAFAAVRLVSSTVAQVPLKLYRKQDNGFKEEVVDHWAVKLLTRPNPLHTNFRLRKIWQTHVLTRGLSVSLKVGPEGRPRQLLPVHPTRVRIEQALDDEYDLTYWIRAGTGRSQQERPVKGRDLIVFHGESVDGIFGLSPAETSRNVFGLSIATERQGARLFKNGAQFSGMFKYPKWLKDDAHRRLKEDLKENYQGVDNAFGVLVLEDGLEWVKTGLTSQESQFLETRKFQVEEVARIFGVPPHLLWALDRATFNNIEELGLAFVRYFIQNWWEEIEQRLTQAFLTDQERAEGLFFEHDPQRLLRGDTKAQTEKARAYVTAGIWTPNDARLDDGLPPHPDGDELRPPPNASVGDSNANESDPVPSDPDE